MGGLRQYTIYATGNADSKKPHNGGYAYIVVRGDGEMRKRASARSCTTANAMQLLSIVEGIKEISIATHIEIVSDSQYALNVLSGLWNAKANTYITKQFIPYRQAFNISYTWKKASENPYLKEAKTMANKTIVHKK